MDIKTVHLEPIAFVIRIFEEGKSYGDPYTWSATAVRTGEKSLEIMGALRAPTLSEFNALYKDLKKMGWKTVTYTRKTPNKEELHTLTPDTYRNK